MGTLANQTYPGTRLPEAAMVDGDPKADGELVSIYKFVHEALINRCSFPSLVIPSRTTIVYV